MARQFQQFNMIAKNESFLVALSVLGIIVYLGLLGWILFSTDGNVGALSWIGLSVVFQAGTMLGVMIGRDMEAVLIMVLSITSYNVFAIGWLHGTIFSILCLFSVALLFAFGFLFNKLGLIKF